MWPISLHWQRRGDLNPSQKTDGQKFHSKETLVLETMMKEELISCGSCPIKSPEKLCIKPDGKSPPVCPTKNKPELIEKSLKTYQDPEIREFARLASIQEGEGYGDKALGRDHAKPIKPRIVETIEFAQKMKYKRLGFVFCLGLQKEAKVVEKLLISGGFEVISAICKAGCIPKETIGIRDDQKIQVGQFEAMCNPILQAMILNDEKTEFNVLMGLCVGHDSLVLKYLEAPCTVLAAKDRLLGHNPLAAIYNIESYYRYLNKKPQTEQNSDTEQPNLDEPVGVKRKSRFIGEPNK